MKRLSKLLKRDWSERADIVRVGWRTLRKTSACARNSVRRSRIPTLKAFVTVCFTTNPEKTNCIPKKKGKQSRKKRGETERKGKALFDFSKEIIKGMLIN
jgi:hypothetical protein